MTAHGEVLDVIDGGSILLLVVNLGRRIIEGEGLEELGDLVGRHVELAEDGMSLSFA